MNIGDFYVGKHASIRFCEDYCHRIFETCKDIPFDYFGKYSTNNIHGITPDNLFRLWHFVEFDPHPWF